MDKILRTHNYAETIIYAFKKTGTLNTKTIYKYNYKKCNGITGNRRHNGRTFKTHFIFLC